MESTSYFDEAKDIEDEVGKTWTKYLEIILSDKHFTRFKNSPCFSGNVFTHLEKIQSNRGEQITPIEKNWSTYLVRKGLAKKWSKILINIKGLIFLFHFP